MALRDFWIVSRYTSSNRCLLNSDKMSEMHGYMIIKERTDFFQRNPLGLGHVSHFISCTLTRTMQLTSGQKVSNFHSLKLTVFLPFYTNPDSYNHNPYSAILYLLVARLQDSTC